MTSQDHLQKHSALSEATLFILLSLSGEPRHGYAIMKMVEEASGSRVRIAVGSLYRIIGRLLSSNLVEEIDGLDDAPRPGRRRRCYGLTALGRAVVQAEAQRLKDTLALAEAQNLLTASKEA